MKTYSDATKRFLLAAKHAELHALEQLTSNCRVVIAVAEVIHQLQKERGSSNIFLASSGERFAQQRLDQLHDSEAAELDLRSLLKSHFLHGNEHAADMRLLNSITISLQGMDNLELLRNSITNKDITSLQSTQAYSRLIAACLNVIFEAADVASDPTITRMLVSLFNFMQGKEYAGQERAWGAIGFAETHFNKSLCEKLTQLQQAQQQSLDVFLEFARSECKLLWRDIGKHSSTNELGQLRKMIEQLADGSPIDSQLSEIWYDIATQRIDQMHKLEEQLAQQLLVQANSRVTEAKSELFDHKKRLKNLETASTQSNTPLIMLFDPQMPGLVGTDVASFSSSDKGDELNSHRSFYDLLQEQAERIKNISHELEEAKRAITEQKSIDRAKLLIMQQWGLSEAQAYRRLQKSAMDKNIKIAEMASEVLKATTTFKPNH